MYDESPLLGQRVWAKQKGFRRWPAKVEPPISTIPCPHAGHILVRYYAQKCSRGDILAWLPPEAITPLPQEEIEAAIAALSAAADAQRNRTTHPDVAKKGKRKRRWMGKSSKGTAEQAEYERALVLACADVPNTSAPVYDTEAGTSMDGLATDYEAAGGESPVAGNVTGTETDVRLGAGKSPDGSPLRVVLRLRGLVGDVHGSYNASAPDATAGHGGALVLRATASHVASSSSEAPSGTADGMPPPPMQSAAASSDALPPAAATGQSGDEDDSVFDLNESESD